MLFVNGETSEAQIVGFTIESGLGTWDGEGLNGGGVWRFGSSPVIRSNIFKGMYLAGNKSSAAGIAVGGGSSPLIERNWFYDLSAGAGGLAVGVKSSDPIIRNNYFTRVTDSVQTGLWAGVVGQLNATPKVLYNTFVNNSVNGITAPSASSHPEAITVLGNIFYNDSTQSSSVVAINLGKAGMTVNDLSHNCVYGNFNQYVDPVPLSGVLDTQYTNINGTVSDSLFNIYVDPQVDMKSKVFALECWSPCIDAGRPDPLEIDPDQTVKEIGASYFSQSDADSDSIPDRCDSCPDIPGQQCCCAVPGDADGSGDVNIADVTFIINTIFTGSPLPECNDQADADGNNSVNIGDVTFLIALIFSGVPAPVCGTTGA